MTFRRPAGIALGALGVAALLFSGVRYASGAVQRDEARRAWEAAEARMAVQSLVDAAASSGPRVPPALGVPVARLVIPSIGLDEVVLEGVTEATLNGGPGHLPGSAMPGEAGNSVISAHRDRHFARLGRVEIGDTIKTVSRDSEDSWVVTGRKVVGRETPALFETADATLTLTTCWPIRYLGTAPDRLILTAKRVPDSPSAEAGNRRRNVDVSDGVVPATG